MPTSSIAAKCEQLLNAYEAKGSTVRNQLLPGLLRPEIIAKASLLPFNLPTELIALYEWRNGQSDDALYGEGDPFWFRDNLFISFDQALSDYQEFRKYYNNDETPRDEWKVDLDCCLPIAAFNGSWYVVACGEQHFSSKHQHPVICIFQGVEMLYHSIETMLDTCIEWATHPVWSAEDGLPEDFERSIWKMHNDEVFKR